MHARELKLLPKNVGIIVYTDDLCVKRKAKLIQRFKKEDLVFLKKNITHWTTLCNPVIDITPDFKATCCFGAYGLIDLH